MAQNSDSWFGAWLNAAKHKSSEVLEFVKKDLEELGSAVKNEASSVVSSTGTAIGRTLNFDEPESPVSSMKRSFSSFIGQMSTVLNPSPDDSDTEAVIINEDCEAVTLTKLQKEIYNLQKNDDTFMTDPDPPLNQQFHCWLEIIEDQLSEDRLTKHLASSNVLNSQYIRLVPEFVCHQMFWKRYLFKKALLEDDLARKEAMEKRELKEQNMSEDNLKWDQEDFAHDIELTEEEQIRLLEEYEIETKEKNLKKQIPKGAVVDELGNEISVTENKKSSDATVTRPGDTKLEIKNEHFVKSCHSLTRSASETEIKCKESAGNFDLETKSSNSSSDGDWEKVVASDK